MVKAARIVAVPIVFVLIAIPLPALVVNAITLPLQLVASRIAEYLLVAGGVPVFRDGNVLELRSTTLEVAQACSGLRSLISLSAVACVVAWAGERSWLRRAVVMAAAIPIAVVLNGVRVAATGVACDTWGPYMAKGGWHELAGWITFALAVGALLLFQRAAVEAPPRIRGDAGMGHVVSESGSRLAVVLALVLAVTVLTRAHNGSPPPPFLLDSLPMTVGAWHGSDAGPLDTDTVRILAADAFINRSYASQAHEPVGFYAAYCSQQRPGVSIHSPLHCLPGTGWEPLDVSVRTIAGSDGASHDVRRMIIRKQREQAVVLYWYSIHGRIVGDELRSKFWLLHDSLRFGRSDAALVRVAVPVTGSIESAERDGLAFGRALLPSLSHLWS